MKDFIKKAINRIYKLDTEQIKNFITILSDEYEVLEIVLDSMTDGVMVANKLDTLLFINKSARKMLKLYKLNENAEPKIWEVIKDISINNFLRKYFSFESYAQSSAAPQKNKPANYENIFYIDSRLLEFRIIPLKKADLVTGNVVIIQDITEKKKEEAKLRRAESLASLTKLAAGVAHEIKNPLGSISIYLQLVEKAVQKFDDSKIKKTVRSNISIINEEINRLNKIIIDFLFAVKPIDMDLNDEDLNKIITDTLALFLPELEKSAIAAETGLSPKVPILKLDKRYIKQVIINLIKNAQFAMKNSGGKLKITTEYKNDQVAIRVTDTGTGIPENIVSRIFEPYFTTKEFGSGIGLTLSYKIIKEHKGDISVKSKVNKGTTFKITLPVPQSSQRLIECNSNDEFDLEKGKNYEVVNIDS